MDNPNSAILKHVELLGLEAKDAVTGFEGVITSLSFDLFGCVQVVIQPPINDEGKVPEGRWLDVTRVKIKGERPVMDRPNFDKGYISEGKKGPAEKPAS